MSSDPAKERLYQAIGRVAAALGSGGRLQLLEFVAQGERSVDALAAMTGLSVANTSKHPQDLRQAGRGPARRVRRGAPAGRDQHSRETARKSLGQAAQAQGDCRLLSRTLLPDVLRGGRAAPQARPQGEAAREWISRVARRRIAGWRRGGQDVMGDWGGGGWGGGGGFGGVLLSRVV